MSIKPQDLKLSDFKDKTYFISYLITTWSTETPSHMSFNYETAIIQAEKFYNKLVKKTPKNKFHYFTVEEIIASTKKSQDFINRCRVSRQKDVKITWEHYETALAKGRNCSPPNTTIESIDKTFDDMIEGELYYCFVRVVESVCEKFRDRPFFLVYDRKINNKIIYSDGTSYLGTGGFATLQEAKNWFIKAGR